MELHWLRATALKTPMSAYLTLMLCANSTSLHRRRVSKVAYPVETHGLYHEVHKSLDPTETDESKPRTGLLGPQVRRVRPRAEHNVRTYRFLPADTRYIRTYLEHNVRIIDYVSSNGKSKRKCGYIYQVRIYVVPGIIPFCSSTRRRCEL